MSFTPDPAAPVAAGSGPYCTDEDVRDALRLTNAAPTFDADRINRAVLSAAEAIDAWLDRPADDLLPTPPPQSVVQANINLAVLEYLAPGAAAAALTASTTYGAGPEGNTPMGVPNLTPWKRQWGLA